MKGCVILCVCVGGGVNDGNFGMSGVWHVGEPLFPRGVPVFGFLRCDLHKAILSYCIHISTAPFLSL